MEQNFELCNKPTLLHSIKFDRGSKLIQWAKDNLFNVVLFKMVLGKLDRYKQRNETRPPSYITYKKNSKNELKT